MDQVHSTTFSEMTAQQMAAQQKAVSLGSQLPFAMLVLVDLVVIFYFLAKMVVQGAKYMLQHIMNLCLLLFFVAFGLSNLFWQPV